MSGAQQEFTAEAHGTWVMPNEEPPDVTEEEPQDEQEEPQTDRPPSS